MNILKKHIKHKSFLLTVFITVGPLLFNVSVQSMDKNTTATWWFPTKIKEFCSRYAWYKKYEMRKKVRSYWLELQTKKNDPYKKREFEIPTEARPYFDSIHFGKENANKWLVTQVINALKIMKYHDPENVSVKKMYDDNGVTGEKLEEDGGTLPSGIWIKYNESCLEEYLKYKKYKEGKIPLEEYLKDYLESEEYKKSKIPLSELKLDPLTEGGLEILEHWESKKIYTCFHEAGHYKLGHAQENEFFYSIAENMNILPEDWQDILKDIHESEADKAVVWAISLTDQMNIVEKIAEKFSDSWPNCKNVKKAL